MTRTLSLLTPSGRLTLGNLLGALRPMRERQEDAFYGLSDLHAMTTEHDPSLLRERTTEMATLLLAAGLTEATVFRQSRVTRTSGVYLRADPADMAVLDGSDATRRAELIAERLLEWTSIANS